MIQEDEEEPQQPQPQSLIKGEEEQEDEEEPQQPQPQSLIKGEEEGEEAMIQEDEEEAQRVALASALLMEIHTLQPLMELGTKSCGAGRSGW